MSETSVSGIVFSETRLKSVGNFVFTQKFLLKEPFLKRGLTFATSREQTEFDREITKLRNWSC